MIGLFIRIQKWRDRTPRNFTGSVLANQLGWQVARVLWLNFWRQLGSVSVADDIREHAKTLRRDGIVIIPNFLQQEVFNEIRKEFEKDVSSVPVKPLASRYITAKVNKTKVGVQHFFPEKHTRLYSLLDTHIMKNSTLTQLGSTVVNRNFKTYREPQVFVNKKMGNEYPDLNSDIYYHADVTYPGVKAFFYLSETTTQNGVFTYAKGTHKLTLKRILWDYRKSIEVAKNKAQAGVHGDQMGRAWHCMTREEEKREEIVGTPMVGQSNSLVVFNVMGFHRRGEFLSSAAREFVMAYYRE